MSQIIKAFTAVFLTLVLLVSTTGILGAFLQTLHAQNLHGIIINELENSDYARGVCVAAFEEAQKYQYELELILYRENSTNLVCREVWDIPGDTAAVFMAKVKLGYTVAPTYFGIVAPQEIIGYAR
jgi:hypothetical protein